MSHDRPPETSQPSGREGRLLLELFATLLLIPAVALVIGWRPVSDVEFEQYVDRPPIEVGSVLDSGYWALWDDYLVNRFPFRNAAIRAKAEVDRAFGESAQDRVVFGDDGWLYFHEDFRDACEALPRVPDSIPPLVELQAKLREAETRLVVLIAPDKAEIVRAPLRQAELDRQACSFERVNGLRSLVTEALGEDYVEVIDLLDDPDGSSGLYFRTDTHWKDEGAVIALEALFEAISPDYWDSRELVVSGEVDHIGDLSVALAIPTAERAATIEFDPPIELEVNHDDRDGGAFGVLHVTQIGGEPLYDNVVILHDSFFWARNDSGIQSILGSLGRRTTFVTWEDTDFEELGLATLMKRADLVIIETVARHSVDRFPRVPVPG